MNNPFFPPKFHAMHPLSIGTESRRSHGFWIISDCIASRRGKPSLKDLVVDVGGKDPV